MWIQDDAVLARFAEFGVKANFTPWWYSGNVGGNPSLTAWQSPDGKAKEWPLYDLKDKRVMLLDDNDIHPAKEADVHIVDWDRTWFLTKYYML